MNFEELAGIVGKKSGTVRVAFSRAGLQISSAEDVAAYLDRLKSPQRYTAPRPASSAAHLAKYRFRSSKAITRMLPALSSEFAQPDTRDLTNWLRRPRYLGTAAELLPESRGALRELAQGLLETSRDLAGVIITAPQLTTAPAGIIGIIGIYNWLPGNTELAAVAGDLAEEQGDGLGCPVRYLPTDLARLDDTLGNPANATFREWLEAGRVEYGYGTLPI